LEASSQRLLAGEGVFDLAGFARALPAGCPVSVELPQDAAIDAGVPAIERARRAVDGVRAACAGLSATQPGMFMSSMRIPSGSVQ
jgi:sugar phosphate isomerase/epimerase